MKMICHFKTQPYYNRAVGKFENRGGEGDIYTNSRNAKKNINICSMHNVVQIFPLET